MSERQYGVDFDRDIEVNKFALHEECEHQSSMLYHYSKELANVKATKDLAETNLKLVMAETALFVRANPPPDVKVTEAVIESLVLTNPKVMEAQQAVNDAKKDLYTYDAAVNALNDKSSMLKLLVQLFSSGYYSVT